jgi:8-oxo-dGTP diphosphatase
MDLQNVLDGLNQNIPQLSIDCVIFGFHNQELKVLLSKLPATHFWALQGGYIKQNEDIDHAARRILEERTGLNGIFLQQFHAFGKANRSSLDFLKAAFNSISETVQIESVPFLTQRFVSIGYYSLVDFEKVVPRAGITYERIEWFDIQKLPNLGLDHAEIIEKALETLRHSLDYALIGFNLMPETFTMNELQKLYETILGESMSRNNFQRKILEMNVLERLEKKFTGGAHKAPYLYKFKR